jgi:hypothetical protein
MTVDPRFEEDEVDEQEGRRMFNQRVGKEGALWLRREDVFRTTLVKRARKPRATHANREPDVGRRLVTRVEVSRWVVAMDAHAHDGASSDLQCHRYIMSFWQPNAKLASLILTSSESRCVGCEHMTAEPPRHDLGCGTWNRGP